MEFVKIIYLCLILGICVFTDYREGKIKNCQVGVVFLGALMFMVWCRDGQAVREACLMMLLFLVVLFPLYGIGAMGAGDVKLLCAAAFYIGADGVKAFLAGVLISGGILALLKLVYYKTFFKRIQYFLAYMQNVIATGQVDTYGIPKRQEEVIRLALPVFIGALCWGLEVL